MTQELGNQSWHMKTPYEWCLEYNVRPYNPENWWDGGDVTEYVHFHTSYITVEDFEERLKTIPHKANSRPRKMPEFLEMKMYGLVIYQLSGIQKGIQYQHATTEYGENVKHQKDASDLHSQWARDWKTSIVLNGGTTNSNPNKLGTMQHHLKELKDNKIRVAEFYEPDLNDALTSIAFLVDERVFDREAYPDYVPIPDTWKAGVEPDPATYEKWEEDNHKTYLRWVEKVGGERNVFLRWFLPKFKLA